MFIQRKREKKGLGKVGDWSDGAGAGTATTGCAGGEFWTGSEPVPDDIAIYWGFGGERDGCTAV